MGLGVNMRVLMIGAHPDDEDTNLITWLSRGRHVSTAYLSLTRGDGGQNVIGNELGEALGVLRTEELLAARRIDGAQQFFTRAFDFGFSKDTVDTYAHWPKDTLLGDVVRVVRAFRPHVIVAVFSGTTRDGHGQHQVSGLLAREAYELSSDTTRYPVQGFGPAWAPLKFYRAARGNAQAGTLGVDVGEYSPLRGESYGEIAGRSRSQHKSQGFGALERKGPIMNYVRREATRVNETTPATSERSMFDGIDTTWGRFARLHSPQIPLEEHFRALPILLAAARETFDPIAPERTIPALLSVAESFAAICSEAPGACSDSGLASARGLRADMRASAREAMYRTWAALRLASGVTIEATAQRETFAVGETIPVTASIYNRSRTPVPTSTGMVGGSGTGRSVVPIEGSRASPVLRAESDRVRAAFARMLPAGEVVRDSLRVRVDSIAVPRWLRAGRTGAMFGSPASTAAENRLMEGPEVRFIVGVAPGTAGVVEFNDRVVHRYADDVRGEVQRPVVAVPGIDVSLGGVTQYVPANSTIDRTVHVRVRSAFSEGRDVSVRLELPPGLIADSTMRHARLDRYGDERTLAFRVRGRLAAGSHTLAAAASTGGQTFRTEAQLVDYEHIRPQRVYRPALVALSSVDIRIPQQLRILYVPGVGDNVAPALQQLGIPVTVVPPGEISRTDLSRFTTVVVGPRAYEAHPALASANAKLFDFARGGGTLVVQYGQYEMTQPEMMPYPITINRPHDRVTHEESPVTILDANAAALRSPNRITPADFDGWVQERSLYMPRTFDERYRPVIGISDPGEPLNRGGILVAPLGRGTYVYTTLAFFRQLPAGVPGAARLFVNLLSAGLPASANP